MNRSLDRMSETEYDLAVIGGGIHGAFTAWDAALRGMKTALVEQGDFAGGTSGNSQRIIHSGLRYLQQLDLARVRESARERRILMRIAPHFVRPLTCLLAMERGREVPPALLAVGLQLYRTLVRGRSGSNGAGLGLLPPRRISGEECLRLSPELDGVHPGAGLLYQDGYARDAARLVLAVVASASRAGADVANYVRAGGPLRRGPDGARVPALDLLADREFEIRARVVIDCSGPWSAHVRGRLCGDAPRQKLLKAVVVGTRPILRDLALGVPSRRSESAPGTDAPRSRYLFFTPERGGSLLGTWYSLYDRHPDELHVTPEEVARIIEEVNRSYPAAGLATGDVRRVYGGLLPADPNAGGPAESALARRHRIVDDGRAADRNVVSILGVKLTTARGVAQEAVDRVVRRTGIRAAPCRTQDEPVAGGEEVASDDPGLRRRIAAESGVTEDVAGHILDVYGGAYPEVMGHVRENPGLAAPISPSSTVIGAQVVHAARREMARKLSDVVFRRTDLGAAGVPDPAALRACASILGSELGWTDARARGEVAEIESATALRGPF
jgi:glycerol-3-phosphate dehydrogenase